VTASAAVRPKPLLRGVFHEAAFYVSVLVAVPLVLSAGSPRATLGAAVFGCSVASCFGASALYHRPMWTARTRSWLARLDHAGVYLLIAGTYTPIGLLALPAGWGAPILAIVWAGALAAIMLKLLWAHSPKTLAAIIALGLGWVGVVAIFELALAPPALALLVAGGVLYSAGAAVYVLRKPDPLPTVFGYHEIFHLLTIAGAACHYTVIAVYVIHAGPV
jgi:hemolysin III